MSKYTTEVRFICEHESGLEESKGYNDVDNIIAGSVGKIFDFDFPMFDESYRTILETKILRHYYTREIGFETVGLWKHFLNMRMNEIMPYYNKLYNSELLEINPFYNVDYTVDHKGINTGNSTNTVNGTHNASGSSRDIENIEEDIEDNRTIDHDSTDNTLDKFADTPQGGVSGLLNDTYLTNARAIGKVIDATDDEDYTRDRNVTDTINRTNQIAENNSENSNGTFRNTDDYLRHIAGLMGGKSMSELLNEYRSTFLNIDMLIIRDLADLFMGVW